MATAPLRLLERLSPPPRPATASHAAWAVRALFGIFATLLILLALVTGSRFFSDGERAAARVLVNGQVVAWEQRTDSRGGRAPWLVFRYAVDGRTFDGQEQVSSADYEAVPVNGPIRVSYAPDRPADGQLEDPRPRFAPQPRRRSELAAVLLPLAFVVIGWVVFEWFVRRQLRLARTGAFAAGEVRDRGVGADWRREPRRTLWVRVEFARTTRVATLPGRFWTEYAQGSQVPLLYDQAAPGRFRLLAEFDWVRFQVTPEVRRQLFTPLAVPPELPSTRLRAVPAAGRGINFMLLPSTEAWRLPDAMPFLRAAADYPEDDGPRLVFADWLDERGDPRGEFIRIQCELADLTPDDPQRPSLVQREGELWARHGAAWAAPLPELEGVEWLPFVRGFPGVVTATPGDFLANAEAIFAAYPVYGFRPARGETGENPMHPVFDPEGLPDSPYLARLALLDLSGFRIDAEPTARLFNSPHLTRLTRLILNDCHIYGAAVARLLAAPRLSELVELSLTANQLHNLGARSLAGLAHLSQLRILRLGVNQIGINGVRALGRADWRRSLTQLELSGNWLTSRERREVKQEWGAAVRF